jgi:hypothetical protein
MSKAIENLEAAQRTAMEIRPKVGGFPYLAETLRRAGVTRNVWSLPARMPEPLPDQRRACDHPRHTTSGWHDGCPPV